GGDGRRRRGHQPMFFVSMSANFSRNSREPSLPTSACWKRGTPSESSLPPQPAWARHGATVANATHLTNPASAGPLDNLGRPAPPHDAAPAVGGDAGRADLVLAEEVEVPVERLGRLLGVDDALAVLVEDLGAVGVHELRRVEHRPRPLPAHAEAVLVLVGLGH